MGDEVQWHAREPNPNNPVVFFDVTIGGADAGRIKMELFADICPKTGGACGSDARASDRRSDVCARFCFVFLFNVHLSRVKSSFFCVKPKKKQKRAECGRGVSGRYARRRTFGSFARGSFARTTCRRGTRMWSFTASSKVRVSFHIEISIVVPDHAERKKTPRHPSILLDASTLTLPPPSSHFSLLTAPSSPFSPLSVALFLHPVPPPFSSALPPPSLRLPSALPPTRPPPSARAVPSQTL